MAKPKIFVDCGFYVGNAIKIYADKGIVNQDWIIYAFEPNPELDVEASIEQLGLGVMMIRKAVWTEDGQVPFLIAGRHDAASIEGTAGNDTQNRQMIDSVDFSAFIGLLPQVDICSMDIEGSEFNVLEKLLADKTIDKIKLLDIEFHHRLVADRTIEEARSLIRAIRRRGIKVKLKDKLI